MRTRVYVDGFDLYYGALKGTPFRWLDPVRLSVLLLPRECAIDRLRYFTARVSGKVDPRAPARQQVYLNALATLPEVEIHYGRFLAKTAWRPLANLPVAGRRIETPGPVTLPEGNHRVQGPRPRTLPVGTYPRRRGRGEGARRAAAIPIPDAVIAEFTSHSRTGTLDFRSTFENSVVDLNAGAMFPKFIRIRFRPACGLSDRASPHSSCPPPDWIRGCSGHPSVSTGPTECCVNTWMAATSAAMTCWECGADG